MEVLLNYKIHRNFLPIEFCDYVVSNYKDYSGLAPRRDWKALSVDKEPLYSEILEIFSPIVGYKFNAKWINISEYEPGESLGSHRDDESTLTIVSEISDGYTGGRFILDNTYIELNKGDVICFDGSKVSHGVEPIGEGKRLSLNMWTLPKLKKTLM